MLKRMRTHGLRMLRQALAFPALICISFLALPDEQAFDEERAAP